MEAYAIRRDAILTCDQKPTRVRFIYSRETTTKKWRIGRLKSKSGYAMRAVSVLPTLTVITPTVTVNNNPITLGPTTRKADVRGGDVRREADIRGGAGCPVTRKERYPCIDDSDAHPAISDQTRRHRRDVNTEQSRRHGLLYTPAP